MTEKRTRSARTICCFL